MLRIGTIWGPLVDPESPFFHIPSYINAVLRGQQPRPVHAGGAFDCCREFADALQAITPGPRPGLLPGRQDGPGDDPYLDTTRLTNDTGFTPAFDVATAVADYVGWRAGNPR